MKCRVVYKSDKTVAVIYPALKSRRSKETEGAWLNRVFSKAMGGELAGCKYDDIDDTGLPDRKDRVGWEGEKGKGITINHAKVQEAIDEKEKEIKIKGKMREIAKREIDV